MWRPGRGQQGGLPHPQPAREPRGGLPLPSQPSLPLPVPRPQNFRAHPQHIGWGQGHAPLGKQKQVPSQHPPLCPQGVEYAKGVLLEPPSNQSKSRGGSGVSVDTKNHLPHPV